MRLNRSVVELVVILDGERLTRQGLMAVTLQRARCELSRDAVKRVLASRRWVERCVQSGDVVYGVTTGFGRLADRRIAPEDTGDLQVNLIRSHASGVGAALPVEVVRTMLALRANALAKGVSGIRLETLRLLIDMLNRGVHPVVPSQGSLGASGDLAPLAHMALVVMGEGEAEYQGAILSGREALRRAGLTPVKLAAKEGLALINGTQMMTAVGVIALTEAERVGLAADAAAVLTLEALRGVVSAFDADLLAVRPHPELQEVAARLRRWLSGSRRVTRQGEIRVQDAYSLRCIPQIHGASWQAWGYARERIEAELNAATDNPIVLADGRILSGGQFHGQPIAIAMDVLKLAAAEWASVSERRVERLVNPHLSGLPPFLARRPGLESGLMIAQYTAASLVSENKVLAHPASVDSIPSSAGQEDHVSMGAAAARQAREVVSNAAKVVAIEMICASQALAFQEAEGNVGPFARTCLEHVRAHAPVLTADAPLGGAIEALAADVLAGCGPWIGAVPSADNP